MITTKKVGTKIYRTDKYCCSQNLNSTTKQRENCAKNIFQKNQARSM